MKVVMDTNVLLECIGLKSRYRLVWDAFLDDRCQLAISVEILFEYLETLEQKATPIAARKVVSIIIASFSTIMIRRWIRWNIISIDPDDNKFFDIAIASNVDYLVTNDSHFNVAKTTSFPKVNIITAKEFLQILQSKTP